jgi:tetratricopeptide (TPR) repeat protein
MLAAMAVGAAVCVGSSAIVAAPIEETTPASEVDMTYFYKNPSPERVAKISGLLDPLSPNFAHSAPLLLRLALLHAIGFNLDIPDSHDKAVAAYSTLIALTPEDPQANYQYGAFLAATTRKGEGIPFLEKARSLGVVNADYWLGWSYVSVGEKAKAIENLENYTKRVPSDQNAARILDAVRNDKVKFEERKTSQ